MNQQEIQTRLKQYGNARWYDGFLFGFWASFATLFAKESFLLSLFAFLIVFPFYITLRCLNCWWHEQSFTWKIIPLSLGLSFLIILLIAMYRKGIWDGYLVMSLVLGLFCIWQFEKILKITIPRKEAFELDKTEEIE